MIERSVIVVNNGRSIISLYFASFQHKKFFQLWEFKYGMLMGGVNVADKLLAAKFVTSAFRFANDDQNKWTHHKLIHLVGVIL